MPRISQIAIDQAIDKGDKLLGSDAGGGTRNYRVEDISKFIKDTNAAGVVGQYPYIYYNSAFGGNSSRPSGSITIDTSNNTFAFADVTTIKFSNKTFGSDNVIDEALLALDGKTVAISSNSNQNNFGIYTCSGVSQDPVETNFYNVSLTAVSTNGSLIDGEFYSVLNSVVVETAIGDGGLTENNFTTALKNKLDGIEEGAEVNVQSDWNATSGDALILNKPTIPTDNSELTNGAGFITSYTETDTLDSVTSRGNTTTNEITVKNVAIGGGSGTGNTFIGQGINSRSVSGLDENTFVGYAAGANFIGNSNGNTALGWLSLNGAANNAEYNTAIGARALELNRSQYNTALGYRAGYDNTTGSQNVYVGYRAGLGTTTGSGNTIVGANVTGLATNLANTLVLAAANSTRIYSPSTGNVLIGTTTDAGYKLDVNGTVSAVLSNATHTNQVYYDTTTGELTYGALPVTPTPTLDQVTTAGNTSSNPIAIGATTIPNFNLDTKLYIEGGGSGVSGRTVFAIKNTDPTSAAGFRLYNSNSDFISFQVSGPSYAVPSEAGVNVNDAINLSFAAGGNVSSGATNLIGFRTGGYSQDYAMTILGNKNILIGTTTDAGYKLDVNGTARISESLYLDAEPTATTQTTAVISATDTNSGIAIVPNGTGAFTLQVPDGTATGGVARGSYSVDLQRLTNSNSAVNRGSKSSLLGGENNKIEGGVYNVISGGYQNRTSNQSYQTIGGGNSNANLSAYGSILGGSGNVIQSNYSTISGGQSNTASTNTHATVVGGQSNTSSGQYSISGGFNNTSSALYSTSFGSTNTSSGNYSVAMGRSNQASNTSAIALGRENVASGTRSIALGLFNTASSNESAVLGGESNTASTNSHATVIGGYQNTSSGQYSISGGYSNVASGTGAVALGYDNTAGSNYDVVGGGSTNATSTSYTNKTIAGGKNNFAGSPASTIGGGENNSANAANAFIGGGFSNTNTSSSGVVSGGESNTASTNTHATVVGGKSNTSSGQYSISGGNGSNASGAYSLSLGRLASASGTSSYSFGYQTNANKEYSFALGRRSVAYLRNQISVQSVDTGGQGQTQYSTVIASKNDTLNSAATTVLSLDGTGTTNLIVPTGTNRVWNVVVDTTAVVTAETAPSGIAVGDVYSETTKLAFKKIGGISSLVGILSQNAVYDGGMDTATMNFSVGSSKELKIEFQAPTFPSGDITVRVVSKVSLVEVAY